MAKINDRDKDKNQRLLKLQRAGYENVSGGLSKLDAYAKRIARAERLNIILGILFLVMLAVNCGVLMYGNF